MEWKLTRKKAVFLEIADLLRHDILRGKYSPDEQIPSVRQLAFSAAVNPNTMQRALSHLESEGILYSKGTVGRFVTSDEEVLKNAREQFRRRTVKEWVTEADRLGITREELIIYIKEETDL